MTRFPGAPRGSYVNELTVVGDEALSPKEMDQRQRHLEKRRARDSKRYHNDPERKAKVLAAAHDWNRRHPERVRELRRESQQRRRADPVYRARELAQGRARYRKKRLADPRLVSVASLHDMRCTGPTRSTGCRCRKVTLYERVEHAA